MTAATDSSLRIVAFGDLDAGVWGAVLAVQATLCVVGTPSSQSGEEANLDGTFDAESHWWVAGDSADLAFTPAGTPIQRLDQSSLPGFDQLCHVEGRVGTSEVACLGRRAVRETVRLRDIESIRDVSAWFGPDDGVALTSLRPRKARGHDRDVIAAAVLDGEETGAVEEPRLSTTYGADGLPVRVGLELWPPEQESEQQYPRRAAGESAGPASTAASFELEMMAALLRCHSRGHEGTGVYLLARPR